jgi:hypothetical protein
MERVHADEGARHGHAQVVQPSREAVDHLLQRQVAQARFGQPVGESNQLHHDAFTVPLLPLRIKVA